MDFILREFVGYQLEDLYYINTDKPMAEQIFTAAHELGHIFEVAEKVWKMLGYSGMLQKKRKKILQIDLAAELLMPGRSI